MQKRYKHRARWGGAFTEHQVVDNRKMGTAGIVAVVPSESMARRIARLLNAEEAKA